MATMGMRVVVDTDAGVDDAVALLMLLHGLPRDAVVGITTVFGNVDVHQANHNVAHILKKMERTDVPVFSGANKPIVASASEMRWEGHGPDGMGGETGVIAAPTAVAARRNVAAQMLVDLAHQYAGELVVVVLGPATNIALAALLDPDFIGNVARFVGMGGLSRGQGNMTPHCEFNVGCDPEASDILYRKCTAAKLHMVPFETTIDHALPWDVYEDIFSDPESAICGYIKRIWAFTKKFAPNPGFFPCDAYAAALLLDTDFVKTAREMRGHIHLTADDHRGANVWKNESENERTSQESEPANVTLITHVDTDIFTTLLRRLAA